jgi:hypothetical protein
LHGTLHTKFLQPNVTAIVPLAASSLPTTSIKTKELSGFFEQFAQTLAKAIGSQGTKPKPSGYMYDSNAQTQNAAQALLCIFCGTPGHFISDCLVCQSYIADGKYRKERLCCRVVNTVVIVFQGNLSKTESMSGTKETQHRNRTQRFWHHLLHCR